MGSLPSFRKAYGVLKDSTKVGLAKVNSDFKVPLILCLSFSPFDLASLFFLQIFVDFWLIID